MLIGLINMSSKAVGRKQERDYTFQSCEGPPDQPPAQKRQRAGVTGLRPPSRLGSVQAGLQPAG